VEARSDLYATSRDRSDTGVLPAGTLELPREVREESMGGPGWASTFLVASFGATSVPTETNCPVFVLTGPLTATSVPQSSVVHRLG
jgi:hypothetical protein